MNKTAAYALRLEPLLRDPGNAAEVVRLLLAESGLPGPRGNLELAWAFADAVSSAPVPAAWLPELCRWAGMEAAEAPTGDAREYLPFCAVVAFGALYCGPNCAHPSTGSDSRTCTPVQRECLLQAVRRAAEDSRWRMREAAAMALQRVGETSPEELPQILDPWLAGSSLLARRGVIAALAHPPLLRDPAIARYALETADAILVDAAAVPAEARRCEEFRVLTKGLSYALSVIVIRLPSAGFELLERWVACPDRDIRKVMAANLKKRRLETAAPQRVAALTRLLAAGSR